MAKVFDATLNALIDEHVEEWGAFLGSRCGVPPGTVTALDTDLSATLQADRLFHLAGRVPAAIHLELESTGRLGIPEELLRYNVAARAAIKLPVHSLLVLLRPKATASDLTGLLSLDGADGMPVITFRYAVVRIWQEAMETLFAAGPGLAPLALLTDEAAANLPGAFAQFRQRLHDTNVPDNVEKSLLGSTFVLCGLRYRPDQIANLYRDLSMTLEDSTTYQLILNRGEARGEVRGEARGETRGRLEEAQLLIRMIGNKRFGPPLATVETAFQAINDRDRLERIASRLLEAASWEDLLATL